MNSSNDNLENELNVQNPDEVFNKDEKLLNKYEKIWINSLIET